MIHTTHSRSRARGQYAARKRSFGSVAISVFASRTREIPSSIRTRTMRRVRRRETVHFECALGRLRLSSTTFGRVTDPLPPPAISKCRVRARAFSCFPRYSFEIFNCCFLPLRGKETHARYARLVSYFFDKARRCFNQ